MFYFNFNYTFSTSKTIAVVSPNHSVNDSPIHLVINSSDIMKLPEEEKATVIQFANKDSKSDVSLLEKSISAVLAQGWLKYFQISDSENPTNWQPSFRKNDVFLKQKLSGENIKNGRVPAENYFYFELKYDSLRVFTSSCGKDKEIVQDLPMINLLPIAESIPISGGIEDAGNYNEGFCFILKYIKFQKRYIWEICADSMDAKDNWMQAFIKLKLLNKLNKVSNSANNSFKINLNENKFTPKSGFVIPRTIPKELKNLNSSNNYHNQQLISQSISDSTPSVNSTPTIIKSAKFNNQKKETMTILGLDKQPLITQEVYTHIIQPGFKVKGNWSPCSKPCGEGVKTRNLSCVDPERCKGELMQRKTCNIKACKDDLDKHLINLNKVALGKWEYLGNWSPCSKPCGGGSQTIKRVCLGTGNCIGETILTKNCNILNCHPETKVIKDNSKNMLNDCKNLHGEFNMLMQNAKEFLPTKVEVNMNNVEVFNVMDLSRPLAILSLSKLNEIKNSNKYPGCFKLGESEGKSTIRLCNGQIGNSPNSNNISNSENSVCEEWVKKIETFKRKCSNQALEKIINEITSNKKSNPYKKIKAFQNKINSMKNRKKEIKAKKLNLAFEEFQKQAREVVAKEDIYEKKLEDQVKERIENDEKKMIKAVQKEEAIAHNVLSDITTISKGEDSFKMKENAVKRNMQGIMKNIQTGIMNKREILINRIQKMRSNHKIKQNKAIKNLIGAKKSIGQKLSSIKKKVNAGQCIFKKRDLNFINEYCYSRFEDNILKAECSKPNQFCYLCCDNEVGLSNLDDISCCYDLCDSKPFDNKCNAFYDKNKLNRIFK